MQVKNIKSISTFNPRVAWPGLAVLLILCAVSALFPVNTETILNRVQNIIYNKLSWSYILLVSFFVILLLIIAFSKWGKIRLGADNSRPQYSFFSWLSMLFAAGMGIGLMYFGVGEPMSHYVHPAMSSISNPIKDAQLATFFHWGIHAWAIFAIMGLILAYSSFRYKLPLSIRSGLYPILKDKIYGPIGDFIDIFALISTFFGIATSMGFGVVQLNAGLVHLGILSESNFLFQAIIIIIVSTIATLAAVSGVSKGIKKLSEANIIMAVVLMLFVLVLGPTSFLLSAFSEGLGNYIKQFADLTFNTFAFESEGRGWFQNWTVMYWAWWISWSPFVGLFIARISKGRTIREYILAVLLVPSMFIFLWMTVFGNGAIYLDIHQAHGALSALADNSDVLLFAFFEQFPLAKPLCVLGLMMIAIFFITSADSGIIVMNSLSSGNHPHSPKWQNAFWGFLLAAVTMAMIYAGGLRSLQTMTLVSAMPFGLVMFVLCLCLIQALRTDSLYTETRLPYGSRNWDDEHWRQRLQQIMTFAQKSDVLKFFKNNVKPAFEELQSEFEKYGIHAVIREGKNGPISAELLIPYDQIRNFKYGVTTEKRKISEYLMDEDNTPNAENAMQYIPVTYYFDGRTGNDIQYLTKDEIINDVLREYERYTSVIADNDKAMVFVDKSAR